MFFLILLTISAYLSQVKATGPKLVFTQSTDPMFGEGSPHSRKLSVADTQLLAATTGFVSVSFYTDSACSTLSASQAEYTGGCYPNNNVANPAGSYSYSNLHRGNCDGLVKIFYSDNACSIPLSFSSYHAGSNGCISWSGNNYASAIPTCVAGSSFTPPTGMLNTMNYADGGSCTGQVYSVFSVPYGKCVAESSEGFPYTNYKCSTGLIQKGLYSDDTCSGHPVVRTFPATPCGSLPLGDLFSQTCM